MSTLIKNSVKQLLALTLGLTLIAGSANMAGAAPLLSAQTTGNSATQTLQGLTALALTADAGTSVRIELKDSDGNPINQSNPLKLSEMKGDIWAQIYVALADGTQLSPDDSTTLALNLPAELVVGAVPPIINGAVAGVQTKIADLTMTPSSITLNYTPAYLAADNRNCNFEANLRFVPKLDPLPPTSPAVLTGGGISGLEPAPPLQIDELPFVPDYKAPMLKKSVTLDAVTGLYVVKYTLSTGNELLYNNTALPLTDELDYLQLVPDSVYFNGSKLTAGTDYSYTDAASGYKGNRLTATLPLAGLARNTDYIFTYNAKLDSRLFSDSSIDKVSLRCESKPAAISYKKADNTTGSFATTPALWEQKDYKPSLIDVKLSVVAGTNGRVLQWDATLNAPGIEMNNSRFYINYLNGNPDGQYLTLLDGTAYNGTTYSVKYLQSAGGGTESWSNMTKMSTPDGGYHYGTGVGKENGLVFYYDGWGRLTEQRKVRFYTQVSEDYFTHSYPSYKFKVGVGMDWWPGTVGDGNQMGDSWGSSTEDELQQPDGTQSQVLKKALVNYDAATGIADWKLTLNERQVDLGAGAITIVDTLQNGDSYLTGSAGVSSVVPAGAPSFSVSDTTGTVTMELTGVGAHTVTIGLQTKVAPGRFYTNGQIAVNNTATATGGNINPNPPCTATSNNRKTNSVLVKTKQTAYNQSTREIVWKLVVNADQKPMYDAVLTDTVAEAGIGHKLEDVTLYSDPACQTPAAEQFTDAGNGRYTLDLGDSADGTAVALYYKTKVTDPEAYNRVGEVTVKNTAELDYNYEGENDAAAKKGYATSSATDAVTIAVVTKQMYRDGTNELLGASNNAVSDYVRNVIVVNPEHLELSDAYINDSMTFGGSPNTPFAIDAAGMKVTAFATGSNTGLPVKVTVQDTAPAEGSLEASLVRSSFVPNQGFRLLLPSKTDYRYEIVYNAKITDRTITAKTELKNAVTYYNGNIEKAAIATAGEMRVASAGGSATGDNQANGKLVLRATESGSADSSYNGRPIVGAEYALYDGLGFLVREGVTNTGGELAFEGLTSGVGYQLAELLPALGYRSSTTFAADDPTGTLTQKVYCVQNLPAKDSTPGKLGLVVPVSSVYLTVDTLPLTKQNQSGDSSTTPVTFTVTRRSDSSVVATATATPGSGQPLTLSKPLRFATDSYTLTETAAGYKPVALELAMRDNRTDGTTIPYDATTLTLTKAAGSGGTLTQNTAGLYTLTNELLVPPESSSSSSESSSSSSESSSSSSESSSSSSGSSSSSSGSSSSSSSLPPTPPVSSPDREPESSWQPVWNQLESTLFGVLSGQTVTVEVGDLTTIPASLLNSIAGKDITLIIYRDGGDPVVINGLRFTPEPGRLYYVLTDILLLYRNPETGGYSDQTELLLATLQALRTADSGSRTLLDPAPDSIRVLDSGLQPVSGTQHGSPLASAIGAALAALAVLLLAVRLLSKRSLKL